MTLIDFLILNLPFYFYGNSHMIMCFILFLYIAGFGCCYFVEKFGFCVDEGLMRSVVFCYHLCIHFWYQDNADIK